MAARDHRLRRARDFQAVWRSRWAVRLPSLILRYTTRPDSPGRMGIVISKAVAKKATDRNRLKRRLKMILVRHPIPVGFDGAIIAQRQAMTLDYEQLTHAVDTLVRQGFTRPRRHQRSPAVSKNPVA